MHRVFGLSLIILALAVVLLFLSACGNAVDHRIAKAESLIDQFPDSALTYLSNIEANELSEQNQYLRRLLIIKANDKLYIRHKSEDETKAITDYYESNGSDKRLAEAFYYGGRVSSDLGDYPQALDYFHKSLNLLPKDNDCSPLRGNVVSQTGRLLNKMRMYSQAVPYLKEVIEIDKAEDNTFNHAYDMQLLGAVYLHMKNYKEAETCFDRAKAISEALTDVDRAGMDMYRAAVKYKLGDKAQALNLIRSSIGGVDSLTRNTALCYAVEIFKDNEKFDTAYLYAKQLTATSDYSFKKNGFKSIFDKELRKYIPQDSITGFIDGYLDATEGYFDKYESDGIQQQQAMFNYSEQQRAREKAEKSNKWLWILVGIVALGLLLVLLIVFVLLYINKKLELNLLEMVEDYKKINNLISIDHQIPDSSEKKEDSIPASVGKKEELRNRLIRELDSLKEKTDNGYTLPLEITESNVYAEVSDKIKKGKIIKEDDPLWKEMEKVVAAVSPDFRNKFKLLMGEYDERELHTALLIKCGIKPKDMGILFGKEKGTISYYRKNLCEKLLGKKETTRLLNDIIRLL